MVLERLHRGLDVAVASFGQFPRTAHPTISAVLTTYNVSIRHLWVRAGGPPTPSTPTVVARRRLTQCGPGQNGPALTALVEPAETRRETV